MKNNNGSIIWNLLLSLAGIGVLLVLTYNFAPGIWSKGEVLYRRYAGWTPEARKANPVRYLKYSRVKLEQDIEKLQNIIKDLEEQIRHVEREGSKLAKDQGQYDELLNRAKHLYLTAEASSGNAYPVRFAGAAYKRDEFITQMKILFRKNKIANEQLNDMKNVLDTIHNTLAETHTKYDEAKGALEVIGTSIIIAEANAASEQVRNTINNISNVQQDIDVYIGKFASDKRPIRSPEEILGKESKSGMEDDFQKYLKGY
jgi:chromosome segregation ATPase